MKTDRRIDRLLSDGYSSWLLLAPLGESQIFWTSRLRHRAGPGLGLHLCQCHLLMVFIWSSPAYMFVWQGPAGITHVRFAFSFCDVLSHVLFSSLQLCFGVTFLGRPWQHWYWSLPEGEQCMVWNTTLGFNVISHDASPCVSHHHHEKAEARQCCLVLHKNKNKHDAFCSTLQCKYCEKVNTDDTV